MIRKFKEFIKGLFERLVIDGGAVYFGLVIGWITSVTFHSQQEHGIKDIAVITGALGGAAIVKSFNATKTQFAMYSVGMFLGFSIHILVSQKLWGGDVWCTH